MNKITNSSSLNHSAPTNRRFKSVIVVFLKATETNYRIVSWRPQSFWTMCLHFPAKNTRSSLSTVCVLTDDVSVILKLN